MLLAKIKENPRHRAYLMLSAHVSEIQCSDLRTCPERWPRTSFCLVLLEPVSSHIKLTVASFPAFTTSAKFSNAGASFSVTVTVLCLGARWGHAREQKEAPRSLHSELDPQQIHLRLGVTLALK